MATRKRPGPSKALQDWIAAFFAEWSPPPRPRRVRTRGPKRNRRQPPIDPRVPTGKRITPWMKARYDVGEIGERTTAKMSRMPLA